MGFISGFKGLKKHLSGGHFDTRRIELN